MKENMLDVLMYLFENYMESSCELSRTQPDLIKELEMAGFGLTEIHKAFYWLEGLTEIQDCSQQLIDRNSAAVRIFALEEQDKMGTAGCGFIHFLEQLGVLNSLTREMVIDRAMALEGEEIDLARLKWVVLMVLFNYPGQEAQLAWMEDFVLKEKGSGLH